MRLLATLLLPAIIGIGFCCRCEAQPALRLKSGRTPAALMQPEPLRSAGTGAESYLVVQYGHEPGPEDLKVLSEQGFRAVSYVPDQALVVAGPQGAVLAGTGAVLIATLEADDKFSPELAGMDPTELTTALVVLYEAAAANEVRGLLSSFGFQLREHPDLLEHHLLIYGPVSVMRRAAGLGEVAYVLPASRELRNGQRVEGCGGVVAPAARLMAAAELSASFGDGWDGPGVGSAALSYYLGSLSPLYPAGVLMLEIGKAVATWSAVVDVNFAQITEPGQRRSLDIAFLPRNHGDGFAFDGPGKTLAHTFYPPPTEEPIAGDVHFDIEEPWRVGVDTDVFSVALHELGHALGLTHSDDPGSVMYPYYRQVSSLTQSDIQSIRQLYRERGAPSTPDPPVSPGGPEIPLPGNPGTPPVLPPIPPLPPVLPPVTPPTTPETPVTPPVTPPDTPPVQPPVTPPAPGDPQKPDVTQPGLSIESPGTEFFSTSEETLVVSGRAWDDRKLKQVTWETGAGDAGVAQGAAQFKAGPIPLYRGTNRILIKAWDEADNYTWRSLTVTKR